MIRTAKAHGTYLEAVMADRYGVDMRNEEGALSLQWAAIGAFLIFIAIAVAAIMMAKAQSQAENIPDVVNTP